MATDDEAPDEHAIALTWSQYVATAIAQGWAVSPKGILRGTRWANEALAVHYINRHPESRAEVIAEMRASADTVEALTGARH